MLKNIVLLFINIIYICFIMTNKYIPNRSKMIKFTNVSNQKSIIIYR